MHTYSMDEVFNLIFYESSSSFECSRVRNNMNTAFSLFRNKGPLKRRYYPLGTVSIGTIYLHMNIIFP
jgi:hypothetical protein